MTLQDVLLAHKAATERNDPSALPKIEKAYLKILEDTPSDANILQLLGTLYMQISKNSLGIQILERAVSLNPDLGEAWNNLGNAYRIDHHADRAERCYENAVRCLPENGENWNNWGTNYVNEGRPARGEEILRQAVKYSPENPHSWWNLALVLLEQGKYEEGFRYYRYGMKAGIRFERFYSCPEWDGGETDHLILYGEQGIGDEIMYMTLLPKVKGPKKITVDCHPRLIGMFKRVFPEIDFYPTRKKQVIDWAREKSFTARCSLGDLPMHIVKTADDFNHKPYLLPAMAIEKIPNSIGISWEGGKKKTRNDLRSTGIEEFIPLIKSRPDLSWYSLQYTPNAREIVEAANKKFGVSIKHIPEVHDEDYEKTLEAASRMMKVITVNTSLVHLCGAAGISAWVLTPTGKAWRYFSPDGKHMAWYGDHIELYQQVDNEPWSNVIERVKHDLAYL